MHRSWNEGYCLLMLKFLAVYFGSFSSFSYANSIGQYLVRTIEPTLLVRSCREKTLPFVRFLCSLSDFNKFGRFKNKRCIVFPRYLFPLGHFCRVVRDVVFFRHVFSEISTVEIWVKYFLAPFSYRAYWLLINWLIKMLINENGVFNTESFFFLLEVRYILLIALNC